MCNNNEEEQVHVLQECLALEQLNLKKATMENRFSEDINKIKGNSDMHKQHSGKKCYETDPKQSQYSSPKG